VRGGLAPYTRESAPLLPALAYDEVSTSPWSLEVFAVCAHEPSREIASAQTLLDNTAFKTSTATCPAGKVATGGGARVIGSRLKKLVAELSLGQGDPARHQFKRLARPALKRPVIAYLRDH